MFIPTIWCIGILLLLVTILVAITGLWDFSIETPSGGCFWFTGIIFAWIIYAIWVTIYLFTTYDIVRVVT